MQHTHNTPRFTELEGGESLTLQNLSSLQLLGGDCTLENKEGQTLSLFNGEQFTSKFYHHTWETLTISALTNSRLRLIYSTLEQSPSPILNPSFYQFTANDVADRTFYRLKNINFLQLMGGDYEIKNKLDERITLYNGQQLPDVLYRQYWDELDIRAINGSLRMIYIAQRTELP